MNWIGGENYLNLIRTGVEQIQDNSQVKLAREFPRLRSIIMAVPLKYLFRKFSPLLDFVRANKGINFPWAVSPKSKSVLRWIPDCQDLVHPEFFTREENENRKLHVAKSIRDGHALYFSSEDSRSTFVRHYGELGNIQGIVRFAANIDLDSVRKSKLSRIDCLGCIEQGYIYMPNQWWKHKNHLLTIKSYIAYRNNGGERHLVLTGTEFDYRFPSFAQEIRSHIKEVIEIHPLGVVDREHQVELFEKADLLLQPSLFEGWSTTIEEGLFFGVPILASNIQVNMEQLEGCNDAMFFDPLSSEDLALKLNCRITKINEDELRLRRLTRKRRFESDLEKVITSANRFLSKKN